MAEEASHDNVRDTAGGGPSQDGPLPEPRRTSISTTPASWFLRGFLVGILIGGCLTAMSYFVRSEELGNLVGTRPDRREAIGFPCELWESGNTYDGYFIDLTGLLVNACSALALAMTCGFVTFLCRFHLTRLVVEFEALAAPPNHGTVQFSLRGLLALVGLASLAAAATRYAMAGRPEVLGAIYLLGPWFLVLFAYLPLGLSWQKRVIILVPTTVLLMVASVAIGWSLKPELAFDKTLLGIFVCWTPQAVLAAVVLVAAMLHRHARSEPHT
ncbi:MAG: hypothetical protein FJ276_30605 [Planctomycetes bacterium]|nr:hypothetical protein [Planctomycetota bacterium]